MDRKKSQHYNFCYDAIPIMFHSQTKDFYKYLERDGLKFLEFWWNYVGGQLPEDKQRPFADINYEITEIDPRHRLIIIRMPPPQVEGEMYFLGLHSSPERKFAWVKLPSTRAVGLVRRSKERFTLGTELGDLTPRGIFVSLKDGIEPNQAAFKQRMLDLVTKK